MSAEANTRLTRLRALLYDEPTEARWEALWRLIDAWPHDDSLEVALDYALGPLQDHARRWRPVAPAPAHWRAEQLGGRATPGARVIEAIWDELPTAILLPPGTLRTAPHEDLKFTVEIPIRRALVFDALALTREAWNALMDTDPTSIHRREPDRPMGDMTWPQALELCNARSRADGLPEAYAFEPTDEARHRELWVTWAGLDAPGWRLPTEAEWEYAARAGEPFDKKPVPDIARYACFDSRGPEPVGSRAPNRWGLYDTLGNICEWCQDTHRHPRPDDPDHTTRPHPRRPQAPEVAASLARSNAATDQRVFKGGSYGFRSPGQLHPSFLGWIDPLSTSPALGIRCARTWTAHAPSQATEITE